ncbi:hypothetical protein C8R44DRAFT_29178 [Mycena epipterygia]|nr:hypothetical protein C8R44DRAFT_29178 [Mycena epipterygia]
MRDRAIFLASFALSLLQVASQTSNVTTCAPLYQWSINSQNQTPCLVAAFLESVCEGPVEVNTIPDSTHYTGPFLDDATLCRCSTVTYSLISACGACQNRTFISWTDWAANCSHVEVGQFLQTIPPPVVVPLWAYLNVTATDNIFNPILAQANQSLSSASSSEPLVSSTSSTATTLSSTTPVPLPSAPVPVSHNKSNAGAIAGGVVGGLVALVAVGLAVLFCLRRRNPSFKESEHAPSSFSTSPLPMQQHGSSRSGSGPLSISPFLYVKDTSETETFPGSPATSAVHTTFDAPSITTPAVQILHRYTGSAEL